MKFNNILTRRVPIGLSFILLSFLAATGLMEAGHASSTTKALAPFSGDNCSNATVINGASLPFVENSSVAGAANDIDPGLGGCAPGAGGDVVYSFTPSTTDTYTIGAAPTTPWDLSLYIVTDCSNPIGTCVAGANARGFNSGESLSLTLNAGTRYFIVVDSVIQDPNAGGFHFSLIKGRPANDTCATATPIDPSRLPFSSTGTTFGAANDLDPGQSCFTSTQSTRGPDVVYQFTPGDTQVYRIIVTPLAQFDVSVYVTTNCSTIANCMGVDLGGVGDPETLLKNLAQGTTYFIVVDGFGGDAGDFTISVTPTIPRTPVAPSDLTAAAVSPTQVDLAWHDNSGDEQGFRIERSLDGFSFAEIGSVGPNVTAFNDTNAFPDTLFFYRVFAFNGFGNSDPSNIAFAQTPPSPIPVNPVIVVDPTTIAFGSVRVTQSDTKPVTITNGGAAALIITSISDPGGQFSIVNKPNTPITIQSTQSITINVRFAPIFVGPVNASFTISSNDPTNPTVFVNLSGTGTGAPVPNLVLNPGAVEFASGAPPAMIELSNTGEADLTITTILPPPTPFSLSGSGTGVIKTGEKKTITVTFTPTSLGVFINGFTIGCRASKSAISPRPPLRARASQRRRARRIDCGSRHAIVRRS